MRDYYKSKMDSIEMPEDVADSVLQKMLAENARIKTEAEESSDVSTKRSGGRNRRGLITLVSLAACAFLVLGINFFSRSGDDPEMLDFVYSQLPGSGAVFRSPTLESFAEETGIEAPAEIAGFACSDAKYYRHSSGIGYIAELDFTGGDNSFTLTISGGKTVLNQLLEQGRPQSSGGVKIYWGEDKTTDSYYASWESSGVYYSLSSASLGVDEIKDVIMII